MFKIAICSQTQLFIVAECVTATFNTHTLSFQGSVPNMAGSDLLRLLGQGGQSGRRMAKEFVPKLKSKLLHGGRMVALHYPAYSGKLREAT